MTPARKSSVDLETRILREFTAAAKADGPSSVVMAKLARDLGISTKTLYGVFPSKADLVHRLMERWAARLDGQLGAEPPEGGPFVDQLLYASETWHAHRRKFSTRFWAELERDYPESAELVVRAGRTLRHRMREQFRPYLRRDLSPQLAIELFDAALARALDADLRKSLGLSAREAIAAAVSVWARGALVEPLRTRPLGTAINKPA